MRGICFKDEMFEAVIHGRKTVTRRMNRRYNKGEILYLKEPYVIDDGFIFYKYSSVYLCDKRWKNKLFMPERYARYRIEITDVREDPFPGILIYLPRHNLRLPFGAFTLPRN